jgi:hypothetical protein
MSKHRHSWWHLLTTTAGPVYKCDCGVFLEPPLTLAQRCVYGLMRLIGGIS